MAHTKVAISLPEQVLTEVDEFAKRNLFSRSRALVCIYLEWKKCQEASDSQPNPAPQREPMAA